MTQLQEKQLYSGIKDVRQKVVIGLLYGTGIRINELCNLQWTDIQKADQRIKIRQVKATKIDANCLGSSL